MRRYPVQFFFENWPAMKKSLATTDKDQFWVDQAYVGLSAEKPLNLPSLILSISGQNYWE